MKCHSDYAFSLIIYEFRNIAKSVEVRISSSNSCFDLSQPYQDCLLSIKALEFLVRQTLFTKHSTKMLTIILLILLSVFVVIYFYLKYDAVYFKKLGVPYIPGNLLVGNLEDMMFGRANSIDMVTKSYNHS